MALATVNYSIQDVANFAYNAGFRGPSLAIATAIAWSESSGVSNAVSTDGYNSHGFWQFIPSTWASITNGSAFSNADNPQANANAAFALQQKSGWTQWSTYNTGAYLKNLPQATTAATAATKNSGKGTANTSTNSGNTATGTPTFLGSSVVGSIVSKIFKPLIDYWIDGAMVLGGMILIIFGIFELWNEVKK